MKSLCIAVSTCLHRCDSIISTLLALPDDFALMMVVQGGRFQAAQHQDLSQRIMIIYDDGKGLSRSRNLAITHCPSPYLLIADDDQTFEITGIKNALKFMQARPDCAVLTGRVSCPENGLFKSYPTTVRSHSWRSLLSVQSLEMLLNVSKIRHYGQFFDLDFGLGSQYPIGEESIFLYDLYQKKALLLQAPVTLAFHPIEASDTQASLTLFYARGASFKRMFNGVALLLLPLYAYRQNKRYQRSFFQVFSLFYYLLKGFWGYKKVESS